MWSILSLWKVTKSLNNPWVITSSNWELIKGLYKWLQKIPLTESLGEICAPNMYNIISHWNCVENEANILPVTLSYQLFLINEKIMSKGDMFMILVLFSNESAFQYGCTVAICGLSWKFLIFILNLEYFLKSNSGELLKRKRNQHQM